MTIFSEVTNKQMGQWNIDKLNLMKDNSFYEIAFSTENNFIPEITATLHNLITDVKRNIPQVKRKVKILGVDLTYYSYKLKPKLIITKELKEKMGDYLQEVEHLNSKLDKAKKKFIPSK